MDDSLETFLINFSRGTGLDGLTGIPSKNDKIIRPLLPFSRKEMEDYATENSLQWREDSSNASNKYLRNKLRHDVITVLKELQPNLLSNFEKTLNHLQQSQRLIDDASQTAYRKIVIEIENKLKIDIQKLLQLSNYQDYLYQWLHGYGFTAWDDIYNLVHSQAGKQVFADYHILLKDRHFLILYEKANTAVPEIYLINEIENINFPIKLSICKITNIPLSNENVIFVDEDKLKFPLIIRKWEEGDYFYPFGMKGKKKLSKYFKDEKLSLAEKSDIWILSSDNEIVWVINRRMDDRFKITETTERIVQIMYHK